MAAMPKSNSAGQREFRKARENGEALADIDGLRGGPSQPRNEVSIPLAVSRSCRHVVRANPQAGYYFFAFRTGISASDVCTENPHVQPELASGASTRPPAGMRLIQQPGRVSVV